MGRGGEKSRSKRRRCERDYLDGQEMGEEELRASRASRSQLASISVQDLDDGGWIWRRHGRRSTFSLDLSLLLSSSEGIGWERVVAKAVGERVEAMAGGEVRGRNAGRWVAAPVGVGRVSVCSGIGMGMDREPSGLDSFPFGGGWGGP